MVYLNIGSNLGDKDQNLVKALEAIETRFGVPLKVSKPYYSLPWGYVSGNSYTNIGVVFDISVDDPQKLLGDLLEIQFRICPKTHRDASGAYVDRLIDIDLIAIDDCVIETSTLIVPHPRMHLRDFVLTPMAELAPEWVHPIYNMSCSQMLEKLKEGSQTQKSLSLQTPHNQDKINPEKDEDKSNSTSQYSSLGIYLSDSDKG